MTNFDKIMRQICTVPLVSIYPQICGICGKISTNSLCNKCKIELKKHQDTNIIKEGEIIEGKYFNELMYIFKYEGLIRKIILDYKFNDKSYIYLTFANFCYSSVRNIQKT